MAELQPSKLAMRVRSSSPAPVGSPPSETHDVDRGCRHRTRSDGRRSCSRGTGSVGCPRCRSAGRPSGREPGSTRSRIRGRDPRPGSRACGTGSSRSCRLNTAWPASMYQMLLSSASWKYIERLASGISGVEPSTTVAGPREEDLDALALKISIAICASSRYLSSAACPVRPFMHGGWVLPTNESTTATGFTASCPPPSRRTSHRCRSHPGSGRRPARPRGRRRSPGSIPGFDRQRVAVEDHLRRYRRFHGRHTGREHEERAEGTDARDHPSGQLHPRGLVLVVTRLGRNRRIFTRPLRRSVRMKKATAGRCRVGVSRCGYAENVGYTQVVSISRPAAVRSTRSWPRIPWAVSSSATTIPASS